MVNYGFVPSKMDGTELEFKGVEMELPKELSYRDYLPKVINQGMRPICVPCSISSYINYSINLEDGINDRDNKVDYEDIYSHRTDEGDNGMSFKDALHYLRHNCAKVGDDCKKVINRYAKVGSVMQLKQALVMNGPCIGGLPVYDSYRPNFWTRLSSDTFQGGHAIAIVGYDEEGFIIRNSWGSGYGDDGYYIIPYNEFGSFMEIWTLFD